MKCIVCGTGSSNALYCSSTCQERLNKGRAICSLKILTSNLLQVRRRIQKLYDNGLHLETNELHDMELELHMKIESTYGLKKLVEILTRDYDEAQEAKEKIGLCGVQKDEELARRRRYGTRLTTDDVTIVDEDGRITSNPE